VQVLGQPPVDDRGLAELADDHVRRLEVAVDDLLAVGVGDGVGDRDDVRDQRHPLAHAVGRLDQRLERPASDQLHGVEGRAVGPASGLMDRDDAGVLEARGDQRLAEEAGLGRRAAVQQLLDGDRPAELEVAGPHHAAEAAAAVLLDHLVAGLIALLQRRRRAGLAGVHPGPVGGVVAAQRRGGAALAAALRRADRGRPTAAAQVGAAVGRQPVAGALGDGPAGQRV
jgi:hypothetical protein